MKRELRPTDDVRKWEFERVVLDVGRRRRVRGRRKRSKEEIGEKSLRERLGEEVERERELRTFC